MTGEKLISELVKPLVLSGIYKDESTALKDIIVDYIQRKKENYEDVISKLQKKYREDFSEFTANIKGKANIEEEEDWMEWKSAIEMRKAWSEVLREVINV